MSHDKRQKNRFRCNFRLLFGKGGRRVANAFEVLQSERTFYDLITKNEALLTKNASQSYREISQIRLSAVFPTQPILPDNKLVSDTLPLSSLRISLSISLCTVVCKNGQIPLQPLMLMNIITNNPYVKKKLNHMQHTEVSFTISNLKYLFNYLIYV